MLKNPYLYRLYTKSKRWFAVFCIFIVTTFFTHKKGVEITPFFVWGMYSNIDTVKPSYDILEVTINNNEKLRLDQTWAEPYRMMIYTSFDKYSHYADDGNIDSMMFYRKDEPGFIRHWQYTIASRLANKQENILQYPVWLKRYVAHALNKNVATIKVDKITFTYNDKGYATIISKTNLISQ